MFVRLCSLPFCRPKRKKYITPILHRILFTVVLESLPPNLLKTICDKVPAPTGPMSIADSVLFILLILTAPFFFSPFVPFVPFLSFACQQPSIAFLTTQTISGFQPWPTARSPTAVLASRPARHQPGTHLSLGSTMLSLYFLSLQTLYHLSRRKSIWRTTVSSLLAHSLTAFFMSEPAIAFTR